ncbi:SDR family oxidoreductase [Flavobacteriaceae bacterium TK19130]|nr:SDR family oxidoreductase [Thermobacterium salinum]
MNLQLKDKRAFISGSTKGIGFATAKLLGEEGATVIINGRSDDSVNKALSKLKEEVPNGDFSGIQCDFANISEIDSLIEELGSIDILINNVGIFENKGFFDIPDDEWRELYEVNVLSGVRLTRALLPKMMKQHWGRVLFISSESALNIPTEMIHYGMTKTAQLAVARGVAELTEGTEVRVNSILPGPTLSNGVKDMMDIESEEDKEKAEEEFFSEGRPTSIIQRFTTPEEVANTIVYFASPLSSATNGASIRAEGGIVKTI